MSKRLDRVGVRAAAGLLSLLLAGTALAQAVPVTTPRLPPRNDAPVAQSAAAPAPARQGAAAPASYAPQPAYAPQSAYAPQPTQTARGYAPAANTPMPPQAPVVPSRADAGSCRVVPAPDRQTLTLVSGAEALPRQHLALGEYRAQQVVHSPDGRWAVAFTKLRGAPRFAAMSIDLERCEAQRTIELSAAGEDARFDGDDAVLRSGGGEQRIGLRDGSVR